MTKMKENMYQYNHDYFYNIYLGSDKYHFLFPFTRKKFAFVLKDPQL